MSARNFAQTMSAGQTIQLPPGRYFYLKTAATPVDIVAQGNTGSPAYFSGLTSGAKFGPVAEGQGWKQLDLTSAAAQAIEIIISDDGLFEIANTVSIVGPVDVIDIATAVVDQGTVNNPDAANTQIVATNTSRRRVTIWTDSQVATPAQAFLRFGGGVQNIVEVFKGVRYVFEGTYSISCINNTGGTLVWGRFEETG